MIDINSMAGRYRSDMGHMVVCPLADSYIHTVAQDAGMVAELAAALKTAKYLSLIHI